MISKSADLRDSKAARLLGTSSSANDGVDIEIKPIKIASNATSFLVAREQDSNLSNILLITKIKKCSSANVPSQAKNASKRIK